MKKQSFWNSEVGKRTWTALITGTISQSEAARLPGAPGQSAISQRVRRYKDEVVLKGIKTLNHNGHEDTAKCPVCGIISKFENLTPEEKVRFRRLLSTERSS